MHPGLPAILPRVGRQLCLCRDVYEVCCLAPILALATDACAPRGVAAASAIRSARLHRPARAAAGATLRGCPSWPARAWLLPLLLLLGILLLLLLLLGMLLLLLLLLLGILLLLLLLLGILLLLLLLGILLCLLCWLSRSLCVHRRCRVPRCPLLHGLAVRQLSLVRLVHQPERLLCLLPQLAGAAVEQLPSAAQDLERLAPLHHLVGTITVNT